MPKWNGEIGSPGIKRITHVRAHTHGWLWALWEQKPWDHICFLFYTNPVFSICPACRSSIRICSIKYIPMIMFVIRLWAHLNIFNRLLPFFLAIEFNYKSIKSFLLMEWSEPGQGHFLRLQMYFPGQVQELITLWVNLWMIENLGLQLFGHFADSVPEKC